MTRDEVIAGIGIIEKTARILAVSQIETLRIFKAPGAIKTLAPHGNEELVRVQIGHLADSLLKAINDAKALRETLEFARKVDEERKETAA